MKLPRFTVRRLMIVVAIVGLVLGYGIYLQRRSESFRRTAKEWDEKTWLSHHTYKSSSPKAHIERMIRKQDYGYQMKQKYENASSHPWLYVEPDPPMPE